MPTLSEALQIALRHLEAGRPEIAEDLCRRVLEANPRLAEAHHLLGAVCHRQGRHQESIDCFRQAVALRPNWVRAHANLGAAWLDQGDFDQAIGYLRHALGLAPGDVQATGLLARAYYGRAEQCCRRDQVAEAIDGYRRAIALDPDYAEAHNDLGTVLYGERRLEEAAQGFRRALALRPDYPDAHYNLGLIHHARGEFAEAAVCIQRALSLNPDYPQAANNLGCALQALGRLDEAMAWYHRALALRPGDASAYNNLGTVWHERGDIPAAVTYLQQAIRAKPGYAEAENNLGCVWQTPGKLDEALACYERSLKLQPDDAKTHTNLGTVWQAIGEAGAAIDCFQQALHCDPGFLEARQDLLCTLHYRAPARLAGLHAAHAEFEQRHAAPLRAAWRAHANDRDPGRPLRLGFLSPDFGRHPVGYFLVRALENLDRRQCALVCYNDRLARDDLTARFQAAAGTWREVYAVSDERLAEQIRADGIDLLFDLAGHTQHNRILVFARKPAPLQLTWIGYVGTTGLRAMDYLLADRYEVPAEAEPYYSEKVLRLPDGYVCFEPPADAPPVEPLPAAASGRVTFGSLNNGAKISSEVIAAWSRILRRVEGSRMILKYRGLQSRLATARLQKLFADGGVEPQRLELLDWSSPREALACYGRIDVALDTFPYSGGLTTCEALWMGTPVVTCPGETFAGRHSLGHLSNVGLTETIARDWDEYVEIAARLAADLPRLADLRAGLRQRVAASPLCDGGRFARNLMLLLRDVWRRWCETQEQSAR